MFTHIMIGTDDVQAAKGFYDAVLGALGYGEGTLLNEGRGVGYSNGTGFFAAVIPGTGMPPASPTAALSALRPPLPRR
ncbi:VOC family protein [Novosphingobium panipatense]|uniref:VOC family protein n=1 Tax=Novosphingobium panipatense TaxID=428991 RepID=UPI0036077123